MQRYRILDAFFSLIQELWLGFQQGQLPDLGGWNYGLLAFFMILQGRPSAVFSGIVASAGALNLGLVLLVVMAARVLVDLFWYVVGAAGWIDRVGGRVGLVARVAGHLQEELAHKPRRFVLLGKLSNGLSIPVVIAAGHSRLPLTLWFPASFAGEFLWTLPLLLFGYLSANAVSAINGGLSTLMLGFTAVFLAIFLGSLLRRRLSGSDH